MATEGEGGGVRERGSGVVEWRAGTTEPSSTLVGLTDQGISNQVEKLDHWGIFHFRFFCVLAKNCETYDPQNIYVVMAFMKNCFHETFMLILSVKMLCCNVYATILLSLQESCDSEEEEEGRDEEEDEVIDVSDLPVQPSPTVTMTTTVLIDPPDDQLDPPSSSHHLHHQVCSHGCVGV